MTRKQPPHLVRPIVYPTAGNVDYRDSAEVAAINDETQHEVVQAELREAERVAGITADGVEVYQVRMKRSCPNYDEGQVGTVRADGASTSGKVNPGIVWVDFGVQRQWSHGLSESTGCWCGPGEYDVINKEII